MVFLSLDRIHRGFILWQEIPEDLCTVNANSHEEQSSLWKTGHISTKLYAEGLDLRSSTVALCQLLDTSSWVHPDKPDAETCFLLHLTTWMSWHGGFANFKSKQVNIICHFQKTTIHKPYPQACTSIWIFIFTLLCCGGARDQVRRNYLIGKGPKQIKNRKSILRKQPLEKTASLWEKKNTKTKQLFNKLR